MRDTCTHHFEPKKVDRVDNGGQGRSKYGPKLPPYCPLLLHILTFLDPPCRPGQIFLVQNGVYMCPAYSTTCFKFNQHLRGVFQAPKVDFGKNCPFWLFLGTFPHSRLGHFRCPKRKSKTTFQYKYTPNQWEIWPQNPLLATGKWCSSPRQ